MRQQRVDATLIVRLAKIKIRRAIFLGNGVITLHAYDSERFSEAGGKVIAQIENGEQQNRDGHDALHLSISLLILTKRNEPKLPSQAGLPVQATLKRLGSKICGQVMRWRRNTDGIKVNGGIRAQNVAAHAPDFRRASDLSLRLARASDGSIP